jgi:two-component system, response regulator
MAENKKIILLVEDNPDDILLTKRALSKSNILNEIVVAHDGIEALDYLFGRGKWENRDLEIMPQVILLDLKMPKIGGLEVLKEIRKNDKTKLLPVIILTTSKEESDITTGYNIGANSYICKPVDFNQFHTAIQQLGLYWLVLNQGPNKA